MFKCFFARKMKDVKYVKDLATSTKGKTFIKQYESCKLNAYVCPAGKKTIGFGHVVTDDFMKNKETITHIEAEQLFNSDIKKAELSLVMLMNLNVELTQGQYDALVSLIFNVGHGNLAKSRLLKNINKQKKINNAKWLKEIQKEWDFYYAKKDGKTIKLQGLVKRREAELAMFLA